MKKCKTCKKQKELSNFGKNKRKKDGFDIYCKDCRKIKQVIYYQKHKEYCAAKQRKYLATPEGRANHNKLGRKYYHRNKDKRNAATMKWQSKNRAKINAREAKRRACKYEATPIWLTEEHLYEIEEIYKKAREITENTGIKYEVDHIIPLQGKKVRGLHVPWNLRIITKSENCSKCNRVYKEI